jgi:Secretion system C-terminal sorting domain
MKLFLILLTTVSSMLANSQSTLQIGNKEFPGISTNTYGIMNSWSGVSPFTRGNRNAIIYPLQSIAIIPAGAQITALRFYRDIVSAQPTPGSLQGAPSFKLYIKNTQLTTFSSPVFWQDTANTMTEIFNGDPTAIVGNATGWITFPITVPYTYLGGNIMLLMEYWQNSATLPSIAWSYDQSSVSPQVLTNYFDATQNRYNSPVTSLPFASSTTGSNVRHPSIQIVYNLIPIPVKLASFVAVKKINLVQLNWNTLIETGKTVFDVQKSTNGINWNSIANIPALNRSNGSFYQYADEQPLLLNYYRLKILEENGPVSYSPSRMVKFAKDNPFNISPSPAGQSITVFFNQPTSTTLQIISSSGKIVKQEKIKDNQAITIDIRNLPAGIYLVQSKIGPDTKKFVKN